MAGLAIARERLGSSRGWTGIAYLSGLGFGIGWVADRPSSRAGFVAFALLGAFIAATAETRITGRPLRAEIFRYLGIPMYGRHLALALAVVPVMCTGAAIGAFHLAAALHGQHPAAGVIVVTLASSVAATLVALPSVLRDPPESVVYRAFALCVVIGFPWIFEHVAAPLQIYVGLATILATAGIGYLGLRSFAETLARFDPVG